MLNPLIENLTHNASAFFFHEIAKRIIYQKLKERIRNLRIQLYDLRNENGIQDLINAELKEVKQELLAIVKQSFKNDGFIHFNQFKEADNEAIQVQKERLLSKLKASIHIPNQGLQAPALNHFNALLGIIENKHSFGTAEAYIDFIEGLFADEQIFQEQRQQELFIWLENELKFHTDNINEQFHIERETLLRHIIPHQNLQEDIQAFLNDSSLHTSHLPKIPQASDENYSLEDIIAYLSQQLDVMHSLEQDEVIFKKIILFAYVDFLKELLFEKGYEEYLSFKDKEEEVNTYKIILLNELNVLENIQKKNNYIDIHPVAKEVAKILDISLASAQTTVSNIMQGSKSSKNPYNSHKNKKNLLIANIKELLKK